jgi:hypothetical protein
MTNQKINETIMTVAIAQVLQEMRSRGLPPEEFNELTTQKANSVGEIARAKANLPTKPDEAPVAGFAQRPRNDFERRMDNLIEHTAELMREKDEMENCIKLFDTVKKLRDEVARFREERERVEEEWRQMWFFERWFFTFLFAFLEALVWLGFFHR